MNTYKALQAVIAELDTLYNSPSTEEVEDRIAELESEQRSLAWDMDARIW